MDVLSTREFLEAREKKLGSAIIWKSYAVWYASINGDKREYGVFLYTDGKTLVFEDFERTPTLMGIPVASIKKEKYEKYEVMGRLDIRFCGIFVIFFPPRLRGDCKERDKPAQ